MIQTDRQTIYSNLFYYDFNCCFYRILKNINYDISEINKDNKLERNVKIGIIQKENKRISNYLNNSIEKLIDWYIIENEIDKDDIVMRLKDGIISKKEFKIINSTMPFELDFLISKLIITLKNNSWLIIKSNGEVEVKGIRDRPASTSFYNFFANLNFSNEKYLMDGLDNIRIQFLKSENLLWFALEDGENFKFILINGDTIHLNRSSMELLDPNDIDKFYYYDSYLWPFIQAIMIHIFLKGKEGVNN